MERKELVKEYERRGEIPFRGEVIIKRPLKNVIERKKRRGGKNLSKTIGEKKGAARGFAG